MLFRVIVGFIVPFCISINTWAGDVKLNPSHPEKYSVITGDTLWSIAGKFLQNPWQWQKIWKKNPQIENPDLIYPGDVISFSIVDGKPQLTVASRAGDEKRAAGEKTLFPHIRVTSLDEAIQLIPVDAIAPFLTSPRIVSEQDLAESPYIIDFAGEHLVAGAGDRVYVRAILKPKNLGYTVYRQGNVFTHPDSGKVLGYEAEYIADTVLQAIGDPATLLITKSKSELRKGDRLMPTEEGQVALNYFPRPPKAKVKGSIISVLSGVVQIGQHNVVAIDLGTINGIQRGHVLEIYQRGQHVKDNYGTTPNDTVKLPDEDAGALMVFRTFKNISYALVMESSAAIHVQDYVVTP
jgi:hypothetical protein